MVKLPIARNKDIVVQELGKELLIYDLLTHKACQLNETSMIVFNHCDGQTSFDDLKRTYGFSEDLIHLTLGELAKEKLLAEDYQSRFAGVSRRAALRQVGLATMIALPVVIGLTAPTAAMAASTCVNPGGMQAGAVMYNCGSVRYGLCQAGCQGNPAGLRNCCSNTAKIDPTSCPVGTDVNQTGCTCVCA